MISWSNPLCQSDWKFGIIAVMSNNLNDFCGSHKYERAFLPGELSKLFFKNVLRGPGVGNFLLGGNTCWQKSRCAGESSGAHGKKGLAISKRTSWHLVLPLPAEALA